MDPRFPEDSYRFIEWYQKQNFFQQGNPTMQKAVSEQNIKCGTKLAACEDDQMY